MKICFLLIISHLVVLASIAQSDTLSGELSYNFLGYPTLYKQDSSVHEICIRILEQKRLTKKQSDWKVLQQVYRQLKSEGKECFPCIKLRVGESYKYVYLPVEEYHKLIMKSSEELTLLQEKVVISAVVKELHPHYFALEKLLSYEWIKTKELIYGRKFANVEYKW